MGALEALNGMLLFGLTTAFLFAVIQWVLSLATTASVVLFGVEDGIMLALVLSLLEHVRHSYRPPFC